MVSRDVFNSHPRLLSAEQTRCLPDLIALALIEQEEARGKS